LSRRSLPGHDRGGKGKKPWFANTGGRGLRVRLEKIWGREKTLFGKKKTRNTGAVNQGPLDLGEGK